MSMLKNVGIGVAGVVVVAGLGYLGFKGIKKLRGKKEEDVVEEVKENQKDNIQKYYDDLIDSAKLTKEEVDELANKHFNKK